MNEAMGAAQERRIANCDQEAWVQERIHTAMKMGIALWLAQRVGADKPSYEYGLRGIAEGAAIEVIRTLGMEPAGVNLRTDAPSGNVANLGKI